MAESKIERYLDELYLWNRRINLTRIPRSEAGKRLIGETEGLLGSLDPGAEIRCADIGSGNGCPGLVMALLRPDIQMVLIESDQRKGAFLTQAAAVCDCTNVEVAVRRAEELGADPKYRDSFDMVVSRATANIDVLREMAAPLLRPSGTLAAMISESQRDNEILPTPRWTDPDKSKRGLMLFTKLPVE